MVWLAACAEPLERTSLSKAISALTGSIFGDSAWPIVMRRTAVVRTRFFSASPMVDAVTSGRGTNVTFDLPSTTCPTPDPHHRT